MATRSTWLNSKSESHEFWNLPSKDIILRPQVTTLFRGLRPEKVALTGSMQ